MDARAEGAEAMNAPDDTCPCGGAFARDGEPEETQGGACVRQRYRCAKCGAQALQLSTSEAVRRALSPWSGPGPKPS